MKSKKILAVLLILIFVIALIPTITKAASNVTVQSISVTSKAGTYKTGEVVTIEATLSGNVVAGENSSNSLSLKFGTSENYGRASVYNGTVNNNKITFQYTIKDTDSGELSLRGIIGTLKDEQGENVNLSFDGSLTGNKVTANPIVWTDASKAKININDSNYLKIENVAEINSHRYYTFITNTETQPKLELENGRIQNATQESLGDIRLSGIFEKTGDIYLYVCEEQINYESGEIEHKFLLSSKIERPAQKNLGSRMKAFFFSDYTSTFLYEPNDMNDRNINLKIGKITDTSILLSIKNNEKNALSKLLSYAKSAESIYTGKVALGRSETITKNINIEHEVYYYVYMVLDDENGTYYPVEDVSLYQGLVGETVGKNLFDYLDDQFKWNIGETNYFSDFGKIKIDYKNNNKTSINISNIVSENSKNHTFYYYISNSRSDIPETNSNLWTKVSNITIAENGIANISMEELNKLSYINKVNFNTDVYMYIYEVITDKDKVAEGISGEYKLVLNGKKVGEEPDNSIAGTRIPQTGESIIIISTIAILIVSGIVAVMKIRKYKEI